MRYNINLLIPELLQNIPEIQTEYLEMLLEYRDGAEKLSEQDIQELRDIRIMHNIPESDLNTPGISLVFDALVTPLIVKLAVEKKSANRLSEIMEWIETLAKSEVLDIHNLISVCTCESLITTYEDSLSGVFPFMGKRTRELCKLQFDEWRLSPETFELFKNVNPIK